MSGFVSSPLLLEDFMARLFVFIVGLTLAVFSTVAAAQTTKPAVPKIDAEQFDKLRQKPNAVVLDVRTAQEFAAGHVPGAVNLDISDPTFNKKLDSLDKSKTYLVHCARGVRSNRAVNMMSSLGLAGLFDYHGGFDDWKKQGKPVEK
jgi:rhodanese-related sulfurtransferase